jgi:uncharacterized protein VirK/YbjX
MWDSGDLIAVARRVRFLASALSVYRSITPIINAAPETPLAKLMNRRPETIGAVVWPYQCCGWDAKTRLYRIREHYRVIENLGRPFDFSVDEAVRLADLSEVREGFEVVLDQPKWFMREGQLSLNLFLHNERIYTLAFSFFTREKNYQRLLGLFRVETSKGYCTITET